MTNIINAEEAVSKSLRFTEKTFDGILSFIYDDIRSSSEKGLRETSITLGDRDYENRGFICQYLRHLGFDTAQVSSGQDKNTIFITW